MRKYSKAIFGSSLRNDFDKYSDRDLLIVADDYNTLNELKLKYANEGWSISFYTYEKLKYLSKIGGLFIQHLKDESHIIKDDNCKLQSILSSFKPKNNYNPELNNAKKYFDLTHFVSDTTISYAWLCDVLYVGLRNYLIFENSNNRIYEFSFLKLLSILKNENRINQSEFDVLRELRVVKRNYRTEILDELPSKEFTEKVILILSRLSLIPHVSFVSVNTFQSNIERTIFNTTMDSYQKLRLIEGYYISAGIVNKDVKKIVSNPQFYACKFKDEKFIKGLLKEIKTPHNKTYTSVARSSQPNA